jgi:hypothetical protein
MIFRQLIIGAIGKRSTGVAINTQMEELAGEFRMAQIRNIAGEFSMAPIRNIAGRIRTAGLRRQIAGGLRNIAMLGSISGVIRIATIRDTSGEIAS